MSEYHITTNLVLWTNRWAWRTYFSFNIIDWLIILCFTPYRQCFGHITAVQLISYTCIPNICYRMYMHKTNNLQLHCENLTYFELFLPRKTCNVLDLYFTLDKMFRFVLEWLIVNLLKAKSPFIVSIQNAVYILEEFEGLFLKYWK